MKRIQSSMKIFATLWLMLATVSAFAQNARVSGVVSDENGEPLMGAAVIVKGTTTGTTTGLDGDFTLEYPQGATLTVSFIGYLERDVAPGNRSHIEVSLEPDTKLLDEVVVIGYGTVKRKDLTGSVASVRGEDIEAKKTTTLSTALQGALSGVMVTRGCFGRFHPCPRYHHHRHFRSSLYSGRRAGEQHGLRESFRRAEHLRAEGCCGRLHLWIQGCCGRHPHHHQARRQVRPQPHLHG